MTNRLLVGVLGNQRAGKSHTWYTMFERKVKRGKWPRCLELRPEECVKVFLVNASFEERGEKASDILDNQNCRIVLCSMQYTKDVRTTLDYFIEHGYFLYIQWLNPGYGSPGEVWDRLGLVNEILSVPSIFSIRDGRSDADDRDLLLPC